MKALLVLLLCLMPSSIVASSTNNYDNNYDKKVVVFISRSGDDSAGSIFTYHLKEAIERSARYTLDTSSFAIGDRYIYLVLVTAKMNDSDTSSAISMVGQRQGAKCVEIFIHQVLAVGSKRAEEMGKEALADIDAQYSK
jgi:hypothetical protein